jgi:UDPglucose 6-dehydrogenase
MGADVNMVRKGIGSDPRIGNRFIYPGIGYGGSCFPKDVKALVKTARENGYEMRILQAVEDVNDDQKSVLFSKIMRHFNGNLGGRRIGLWGLSFKPNTDDMREAPSLVLIEKLLEAGASVIAYDPVASKEAGHIIGDKISYAPTEYAAVEGVDALCLVTEWAEFRVPDWDKVKTLMKGKVVFDGRNLYEASAMRERGFEYYGIGVN